MILFTVGQVKTKIHYEINRIIEGRVVEKADAQTAESATLFLCR